MVTPSTGGESGDPAAFSRRACKRARARHPGAACVAEQCAQFQCYRRQRPVTDNASPREIDFCSFSKPSQSSANMTSCSSLLALLIRHCYFHLSPSFARTPATSNADIGREKRLAPRLQCYRILLQVQAGQQGIPARQARFHWAKSKLSPRKHNACESIELNTVLGSWLPLNAQDQNRWSPAIAILSYSSHHE